MISTMDRVAPVHVERGALIERQRAAISEADAAGDVAAVYADIRAVTGIPMVNLVWRELATEPERLAQLWAAVRDIAATSQAPRALIAAARDAVAARRVTACRSPDTRVGATLAAFDRGNACNLLALVALRAGPGSTTRRGAGRVPAERAPLLPLTSPILARAESIAPVDRDALDHLAAAARPPAAPLAAPSLLHHLAAHPGLLSSLASATQSALSESLATPRTHRRGARRGHSRRVGAGFREHRRARAARAARSVQRHDRPHDGAQRPAHPRAPERRSRGSPAGEADRSVSRPVRVVRASTRTTRRRQRWQRTSRSWRSTRWSRSSTASPGGRERPWA